MPQDGSYHRREEKRSAVDETAASGDMYALKMTIVCMVYMYINDEDIWSHSFHDIALHNTL